jgi:hypothetical protein
MLDQVQVAADDIKKEVIDTLRKLGVLDAR